MNILHYLAVFSSCFGVLLSTSYCNQKNPTLDSLSILKTFCSKHNGTLRGYKERECHKQFTANTSEIIGIDMSNCSLTRVQFNSNNDKFSLQWLAINHNNMELNKTIGELRSANAISTIVINVDDICLNFHSNQSESTVRVCTDPIIACNNDKCPDHSKCTKDGPGLFACPCLEDWKSYKCLKKKGFPYVAWITSISAGTVFLCIVIRIMQRKDRKLGEQYRRLQDTNRHALSDDHTEGIFG